MTARKAAENEESKGEGTADEETGKDAGGSGSDGDGLESRIRALVHEAVESLMGSGSKSSGSRTQVDDEEALFQRVKKAQEKIAAEEAKEGRLVKVEETLKTVVEKPPARDGFAGKVSRFLWGGE